MDNSKTFTENKNTKAAILAEDAKKSARTGYDTENQLSNNLISITLAFVALIVTAVSTSTELGSISVLQKWLILAAMIIFCVSILAGLINYFANLRFHQEHARLDKKAAKKVHRADTASEVKAVPYSIKTANPDAVARNNVFLIAQIVLLCIGLALTVLFVAFMLFGAPTK